MSRAGRGRPLRFVGTVALGWIGLRLAMLWPLGSGTPTTGVHLPLTTPVAPGIFVPQPAIRATVRMALADAPALLAGHRPGGPLGPSASRTPLPWSRAEPVSSADQTEGAGAASMRAVDAVLPPQPAAPALPGARRRWSGSAWLALRPGQGIGAAPAVGQLGGSQYGLRLLRALDSRGRVAAFGRIAGPMRGAGAEAALGLEWQPLAAPLRLSVEQRFGLDGGRGGPGVGVVMGLDRGAAGFRLEAYGQAGMILRNRLEPYADGALRLTRAVMPARAAAPAIGIGVWGAAQRGPQRLDIGPTILAPLPIGAFHARVALDWRQRIAVSARPGSGIALTLGSDF
ncbi:hypothetical protein [Sphingomonas pituitosa]|uniref:hypothetical protein n=1 Tax=Sphingomonas pituitosa TaxID=99597 RepID=UPI00082C21B2|nr:hypothetical protein [Sphingomonas pituitosa]